MLAFFMRVRGLKRLEGELNTIRLQKNGQGSLQVDLLSLPAEYNQLTIALAQPDWAPLLQSIASPEQIGGVVERVDRSLYEEYESTARGRVCVRDPEDWPVVAVALLLELPIWTEDQDFFGSGVATWTTDRVEWSKPLGKKASQGVWMRVSGRRPNARAAS